MKKKNALADLNRLRERMIEALGPLAEDARLVADMPLLNGQVRLSVTAGPMRVTAWGEDLTAATASIIEKITSAQRSTLGKGGEDSPLLPL